MPASSLGEVHRASGFSASSPSGRALHSSHGQPLVSQSGAVDGRHVAASVERLLPLVAEDVAKEKKKNPDYDTPKKLKFEHVLVAGIDKYPRKVTRSMKEDRIKKRTQIKPFVKHVNLNHIMPTRYQLSDMDLKKVIGGHEKKIRDGESKEACEAVKKIFEERYRKQNESNSQRNKDGAKYFFKKLRF